MKISEASAKFDITADTLRYYERIGLIHNVQRDKNGIRNYSEENCATISFIKCMRAANISIDGLIEYMALYQKGPSTRQARQMILIKERKKLEERMDHMKTALERLNYKISLYENGGPGCPPSPKK